MKPPDIPDNEDERLQAIRRLDILDTPPEGSFDDLTRLASLLCDTQVSTVSIVDEERQWFKSVQGPLEARETGRDISFCGHAINNPEMLIVEDTLKDERFADNPLVQGDPKIRFYAGAPIVLMDGHIIGTLCVFDPNPKTLSPEQKEGLVLLARQVTERLNRRVSDSIARNLGSILELGNTNLIIYDPLREKTNYLDPALLNMLGDSVELDTRALFARLFPDIEYDRFFSRERLNDSELGLPRVTRSCLPGRSPGRAELRLFRTSDSDRGTCILAFKDRTELFQTRDSAEYAQSSLRVFQELAKQSKNAFMVTDADGKVQWVNASFESMSGYTLEEIEGHNPGEMLQGKDTSELDKQRISRHLRANQPVVQNILNYTKAGKPYWTELYIEPVRDDNGKVTHFVSTQTDITRLLQERQTLEQSRSKADQANRAKSQFLATISHELRTPLNGINAITERLLREAPESLSSMAETLDQSSKHLISILDDLLDLSQIESGQFQLDHQPFSVINMLEEVEQLFGSSADMVGSQLRLNGGSDLPAWVSGDPIRLKQVLMNLVSNAVNFTQNGHIELSASSRLDKTAEGNHCLIAFEVSDDGPGIEPDDQDRIFESFEQSDHSQHRTLSGAGLGLSISRQLVEAMQGTLTVESIPGDGSTFSFEIPLPIVESEPDKTQAPKAAGSARKPLSHALIIDDDHVSCKVLEDLLKQFGCKNIHTGQLARHGLAILENIQPDVVFMDLKMPDMNGIDAIARLQRLFSRQRRAQPLTIACTAEVSNLTRRKCLSAGFAGFLGKPVTGTSLQEVLSDLGITTHEKDDAGLEETSANAQIRAANQVQTSFVDLEFLMASFLGNKELLGDFLSLLTKTLPEYTQQVKEALESSAIATYADAAHSIKGLVGYFQGNALVERTEELEAAMRQEDSENAKAVFQPLEADLKSLNLEVLSLLKEINDH